ncbi:hypothetical protein [Sorangium sp. So ce542]|uniref:hypothetical protein n=1 Tax=Sorangium sp. So ce542 TaxID=3133316 RepID=UPI003F5DDE32
MRSTFWAGLVGVCLACGLSGLGCGDDGAPAPEEARGGEATGEASCTGLDPSSVVDELTPAEAEQACKGYRTCEVDRLDINYFCRMFGVLGAKFGDNPGTDDAGVRARCAEHYESCMADPEQAAQLDQFLAELQERPCVQPTQCTATIAELDACAAATRAYSLNVLPECGALTVAWYDQERDTEAVMEACGKLSTGCMALFALPEEPEEE